MEISGDYQYKALHHGPRLQRFWHRNKIGVLRDLVGTDPVNVVVEVGCGSGNLLLEGHLPARTVVGVDASLPALRFCASRRGGSRFHFSRAAGERLPFRDASVDLVILVEVIEHLPEPALTLRQIARVLRPGGRLVMTTPNYDWPSPWPLLEWLADKSGLVAQMRDAQHVTRFGPTSLAALLERESFEVLRIGTMYGGSAAIALASDRWADAAVRRELGRGIRHGALVYSVARTPHA
ncbi:MAG: class I SAM-dependent methyltransferase [Vicinamibacteraceae bacterium]